MRTPEYQPIEQDPRLLRAIDMLESSGVCPFSVDSVDTIYQETQNDLSGWNFRDTCLFPVRTTDTLKPATRVACIEIGGTKLRVQGFTADTSQTIRPITERSPHPVIFHNKQFSSVDSFMQTVIENGKHQLDQLIGHGGIDTLAIVFSFDADTIKKPYGVDMQTTESRLSKGFVIPGIGKEGVFIGKEFIRVLQDKGYHVKNGHTTIVTNDVVDVMASVPDARISLVLGTGFNIGITRLSDRKSVHIYNSEAANLTSFPPSGPEQYVQQKSRTQNNHHAEFIAGGESIGQTLEATLQMLHLANIFPYEVNMPLNAGHLSAILNNDKSVIKHNMPDFDLNDLVSWNILQEVARRQFQRATVVVAFSLAAMIENNHKMFPDTQIDIPFTGSTFKLIPNFQREVTRIMNERLPGQTIHFIEVPGSRGAAFLALREYAKLYRSG